MNAVVRTDVEGCVEKKKEEEEEREKATSKTVSKIERKVDRKTRRLEAMLKNKMANLQFTNEATPHLLLYNVGASCGLDASSLISLLSSQWNSSTSSLQLTSIADVVLVPKESYCFLSLVDLEAATEMRGQLHNKSIDICSKGQKIVLYAMYVEKVPEGLPCLYKELQELFDVSNFPNGLELIDDFISESEEQAILNEIDFDQAQELKSRQVLHFGYTFDYNDNSVDTSNPLSHRPIPSQWQPWLRRLSDLRPNFKPDQCTVNRYEAGSSIASHVDSHSCCTDIIVSLSLLSSIVIEFKDVKSSEQRRVHVKLPRRSVLIMQDDARYRYAHGIRGLKHDYVLSPTGQVVVEPRSTRISLTLRQSLPKSQTRPINEKSLAIGDKNALDEIPSFNGLNVNESMALRLEQNHVHSVYENISDHFSQTRHKPWPKVTEFLTSFDSHATIIDVGCGNGKYLLQDDPDKASQLRIGCDYSQSLVSICKDRGLLAVRSDCLALPFKARMADGLICIAVLHHLATRDRRMRSLREMTRVLRPSGRGLVYVWAKDQRRGQRKSSYLKANSRSSIVEDMLNVRLNDDNETALQLPVHKNRTEFKHNDMLVPWKSNKEEAETFMRFYHLSEEGELEAMIADIEELKLIKSYYDQGNYCVVFEKERQSDHMA